MTVATSTPATLRQQFQRELTANILPFWAEHAPDRQQGGFYGAVSNELQIHNEVPRSSVLCARILWTYSAAYRLLGSPEYLPLARYAYRTLMDDFIDPIHGGIFWAIDKNRKPTEPRKQTYAHAFAIYGLVEFHLATGDAESLQTAQALGDLIHQHTHDAERLGNVEGCARDWKPLADMRLGSEDLNCPKSMNTMLHLMEAYTNLLRVAPTQVIRARQRETIEVFLRYLLDPETYHQRLFFDMAWTPEDHGISFGHDIEASWLLAEAAEVLGDPDLLRQCHTVAVRMAEAAFAEAMLPDGSLLFHRLPDGTANREKHWWAQAEAVVGFYNAYQLSGREELAQAAARCWDYIGKYFIDPKNGDWFKVLDPDGKPFAARHKIGPWECPYHHARMCMEMMRRLSAPHSPIT